MSERILLLIWHELVILKQHMSQKIRKISDPSYLWRSSGMLSSNQFIHSYLGTEILYNFEFSKIKGKSVCLQSCASLTFKGTRGVQNSVWTHLHSFLIIRESIDITMLKPYPRVMMVQQKQFRRPLGVNMKCENWHSDPSPWWP